MTRFKLGIPGTSYWYWVLVHDTLNEFRVAAAQHTRSIEEKTGTAVSDGYDQCYGVVHTYWRSRIDEAGQEAEHSNIGIIRLAKPHLTVEIVSHELVHAVTWAFRKLNHKEAGEHHADLGDTIGDVEEDYAYLYGDTFALMNRKMHKKGLWG